jgi:N-acetyl-1-D-myo-inositol-2-amino-2-deoxy-alpha-D-glucopyranoside deacetylase
MTRQRTILACFAHPDDESFGTGGVLAKHAAQGDRVVLVCATRGECGEISDPALATPETLGDVREGEMQRAAAAIGIHEVIFLDYRDSGMIGTPENDDPRAFVNVRADDAVAKITAIIRRERPAVVITFEPHGGYGHPDHKAVHHHTTAAVQCAAAPSYRPDLGDTWRVPRLCWGVIPRSTFRHIRDEMERVGEDVSEWDRMDEAGIGWPEDMIDITVDVTDYIPNKWAALESHATQFGGESIFRRASEAMKEQMLGREYFFIAIPWRDDRGAMTDLLDGLAVDER